MKTLYGRERGFKSWVGWIGNYYYCWLWMMWIWAKYSHSLNSSLIHAWQARCKKQDEKKTIRWRKIIPKSNIPCRLNFANNLSGNSFEVTILNACGPTGVSVTEMRDTVTSNNDVFIIVWKRTGHYRRNAFRSVTILYQYNGMVSSFD